MPNIDDCLERMEGCSFFSTLDLENGFHHIKVADESIKYISFVVPSGQYEYKKMPFGLKTGPGLFNRFMNWVLADFIRLGALVVFMDDINIFSKNLPEHLDLLKRVMRRLAECRLKIKPSKCKFCYSEIDTLGFVINKEGIRPNDRHLEAVRNMPSPKNTDNVHKANGLFSFFHRFMKGYSVYSAPIRELLKDNVQFQWNEERESIFRDLKNQLTSAPILAIYNPKRETELHCDACSRGFGAMLLQRQDCGRMKPVGYFSKSMTPAESILHSYELETLAVVYAAERFEIYLSGIPFTIFTDCEALSQTLNKHRVTPKITRWALYLEKFDYTIKHRSGDKMAHVDALSRYPIEDKENHESSENMVAMIDPTDIDLQLQIFQNPDETIIQLRNSLER